MERIKLTEAEKKILRPLLTRDEKPSLLDRRIVDGLVDKGLIKAYYNEYGFVISISIEKQVVDYLSGNPHILN